MIKVLLMCLAVITSLCGTVLATPARADDDAVVAKVLAFDKTGAPLPKSVAIGYLPQCIDNPYCQANLAGMRAAAKKYNFTFKIFDAQFSPSTQLRQVQNAVAGNFAGYIFAPTAAAPACAMYRQYLKPTGKPVVVYDMPMCGDPNQTPGVAATVIMQTQSYYDAVVDAAFASCKGSCIAAAEGGYVGTDLYNYWENALAKAKAKYPNVKLVVDEPANFSPQVAQRVTQDALTAHPDINLIISQWDDMSRGAIQAIKDSGKTLGKNITIFSDGATTDGVNRVKDGELAGTGICLPYQEGYYAGVAMVMALEGHPLNGFINEADLPPITQGPGTIILTKANAGSFKPSY